MPDTEGGGTEAQGSYLIFAGKPAQEIISIRGSRRLGVTDVTGFASPPGYREVAPGEIEPAEIAITAITEQPFVVDRTVGPLTVRIGEDEESFQYAFVTQSEVEGRVGEKVQVSYTFVAY